MKLKEFIKALQLIQERHGDDAEVIMADNIPVVRPFFSNQYSLSSSVVITDQDCLTELMDG